MKRQPHAHFYKACQLHLVSRSHKVTQVGEKFTTLICWSPRFIAVFTTAGSGCIKSTPSHLISQRFIL